MALALKRPNSDVIVFKQHFVSRLAGLFWLCVGGLVMYTLENSGVIWLAVPCLLIGIHLCTSLNRVEISAAERHVIWKRRFLLLPIKARITPFAGIRSVRVEVRGVWFQVYWLRLLLVDGSKLTMNRTLSADKVMVQANEIARFIGRPLVYQEPQDAASGHSLGLNTDEAEKDGNQETPTRQSWRSVIPEQNQNPKKPRR